MTKLELRQLIKEAIHDRLKMIDEAGDRAATDAKIKAIEKDIQEAKSIKSAIPTNINAYVDPEIISDLMENLDFNIKELEKKKEELQAQLQEGKPSAGMTKKEKSSVAKKARAGKDIGKKGKGFEKVAKTAEKQYGSKEAGQKVAAAAMWKSQAKK